jgi:hypothetical protein
MYGFILRVNKTRLHLCDKKIFNYSIKLVNSLPLDIRKSDKYSNLNLLLDEYFIWQNFMQFLINCILLYSKVKKLWTCFPNFSICKKNSFVE